MRQGEWYTWTYHDPATPDKEHTGLILDVNHDTFTTRLKADTIPTTIHYNSLASLRPISEPYTPEDGDVIRHADGAHFVRLAGGMWFLLGGFEFEDHHLLPHFSDGYTVVSENDLLKEFG